MVIHVVQIPFTKVIPRDLGTPCKDANCFQPTYLFVHGSHRARNSSYATIATCSTDFLRHTNSNSVCVMHATFSSSLLLASAAGTSRQQMHSSSRFMGWQHPHWHQFVCPIRVCKLLAVGELLTAGCSIADSATSAGPRGSYLNGCSSALALSGTSSSY